MDLNQTVTLSTLTTVLAGFARRATTRAEKHYIYGVVEGIGTAIGKGNSNFNNEEFLTECAVQPEWASIAA
jgi:hypothetical protein